MMIHKILMAVAAAGCVTVAAAASPAFLTAAGEQAPTKTTNSGVYTAAQAERGKKSFSNSCTACHDTARFSGETFLESWNNKAMKELWDVASGTMPEDNPGSLKQQEYADILAYFLQLNEYPAGDAELAPGAAPMANIKVERKMSVSAPAPQKSVKAGVYTAAQAERGQTMFRAKCASCHAPNRFTDDLFYTSFAGKPLWQMFDVISDSMPEDNPGSMKKEEYADVIAYLLQLNNFPTGVSELPIDKDALSAMLMEKP